MLLIRLLLSTALLSALTWLLARLLVLLSALILIILSHSYFQLECELSRDGQPPLRVFVPSSATYMIRDCAGPMARIGIMPVDLGSVPR